MATQKQLKMRIKSIQTIMKVTKAMKMVASARSRTVTAQLMAARQFQGDISSLLAPEDKKSDGQPLMLFPYAADKGLCGAVNSSVVRESKKQYNEVADKSPVNIVAVGTKAVAGMSRFASKDFYMGITDQKPGKKMTFKQISVVAEMIRNTPWETATVVYSRFTNALAYTTVTENWQRFNPEAPIPQALVAFEVAGDQDSLKNLDEFRQIVRLWHINAEHEATEISSRVNAMDNSNKAAKEMAEKLNLTMNKLRQAKITLEICDIVAGAESAL